MTEYNLPEGNVIKIADGLKLMVFISHMIGSMRNTGTQIQVKEISFKTKDVLIQLVTKNVHQVLARGAPNG